ncbi:MAG: TRAP transporter substrate-binding protein [Deltaproteobacteria bacterium]|nr:MAG: TRAP transporter substrate-binding protein [Deltaproteobacteria bacterium]
MTRLLQLLCTVAVLVLLSFGSAVAAKKNPLEAWQPKFDPSGAEFTYLLSCVGHPAIEGVAVGYSIRDRVWQETNGRLYVDFRPLSQLGGEKDVINKLKFGAVQGMLSSSVAAANIAPKYGIVNLPFVVDSFDKLDRFRATPELWVPFRDAALRQGIVALDFTGYGSYGWATNDPVRSLTDASRVNFRIAQAPVNIDTYKAWGLKFTVMPWPDVPQALQTGVISGLDHTPIVCNISKKFTIARNYTFINYAQGLYVHLVNKRWLDRLPEDVRAIFLRVVAEESAKARSLVRQQEAAQIEAARRDGVAFHSLPEKDMAALKAGAEKVYRIWEGKIGPDYLKKVREELAR